MSADFPLSEGAQKLRVLVVDDEPLIASLLADWLTELDCEPVGPAGSVAEAIALIESNALDAAILDVSLLRGQSYPAAEALADRRVPFAFATGSQPDSLDARFATAAVLMKPFDFDSVSRLVASWSKNGA